MRQYISSRNYRKIPVGYSAADVDSNRVEMANYMNCGSDDERSDFFAFNDYSWCDPSSFTTSGWNQKVAKFSNYGIPLFLSEYGCNTNTRKFEEVKSLYGQDMTAVYSGGLVYEYSEEGSKYGLVSLDGGDVKELDDFKALQSALSGTQPPSGDGGYKSSGGTSQCPTKSSTWNVTIGDSLPVIPEPAKKYMNSGAGKGPGLKGAGSQNTGTKSTAMASAAAGQAKTTGKPTGAASSLHSADFSMTPLVCGLVVLVSTVFGTTLI